MALRIYIRKHNPECLERIQTRVAKCEIKPLDDDGLKEYSHSSCKCGWWMSGTSDSGVQYKQHALKVYSKTAAEAKRKEANRLVTATNKDAITLLNLVDAFLKDRETKNNTAETGGIYHRVGYRMLDFVKKQSPVVVAAKDVTEDHIERLRQEWLKRNKLSTVNYHKDILGMIFRYGVKKHNLPANPVDALDPIVKKKLRGADAEEEEGHGGRTLPLDEEGDANYQKILAAVEPFLTGKLVVPGRKFARAKSLYLKDPVRFGLLLELMYETGLRVSDAIHFDSKKIKIDDEIASYTTIQIKTGDPVTVFFPVELADRLRKLTTLHKHYIFFDDSMPWRRFISANIWRTLHDLGEAIGIPGLRPHRFRDSFAVNCLNGGMGIGQLSALLGHQREATTKKYYSPWVQSRHNRLRDDYLAARRTGEFSKVSGGTVVEITNARKRV
jgi:integrase